MNAQYFVVLDAENDLSHHFPFFDDLADEARAALCKQYSAQFHFAAEWLYGDRVYVLESNDRTAQAAHRACNPSEWSHDIVWEEICFFINMDELLGCIEIEGERGDWRPRFLEKDDESMFESFALDAVSKHLYDVLFPA